MIFSLVLYFKNRFVVFPIHQNQFYNLQIYSHYQNGVQNPRCYAVKKPVLQPCFPELSVCILITKLMHVDLLHN